MLRSIMKKDCIGKIVFDNTTSAGRGQCIVRGEIGNESQNFRRPKASCRNDLFFVPIRGFNPSIEGVTKSQHTAGRARFKDFGSRAHRRVVWTMFEIESVVFRGRSCGYPLRGPENHYSYRR